jgi:hypothetical protein
MADVKSNEHTELKIIKKDKRHKEKFLKHGLEMKSFSSILKTLFVGVMID